MQRPAGKPPEWATDEEFTSGPATGDPTKIEPLSGEKEQGWSPRRRPPAKKFNWLQNRNGAWISHLSALPVLNWHLPVTEEQSGPSPIDTSHLGTLNGKIRCFYSTNHSCWFVPGSDAVGFAFAVDEFVATAVPVGGTEKYAYAVESNDRIIVFPDGQDDLTARRSGSNSLGGWADVTLSSAPSVSAHITDAAVFGSDDDVIVIGEYDGNIRAWTSSDNGGVFAANTVGALTGAQYPQRICIGRDERVWTWVFDVEGDGGHVLYYSDAHGVGSWSSGTATGLSSEDGADGEIFDILYLWESDTYCVVREETLHFTSDPLTGPWVTLDLNLDIIDATTDGAGVALWIEVAPGTDYRLYYITDEPTLSIAFRSLTTHTIAHSYHATHGDQTSGVIPGQFLSVRNADIQASLKA